MRSVALLQKLTEKQYIPWFGAILGALLAAWVIFQSHGVINRDGILYIEVAKQFDTGAWQKGYALYNWPLYPLLIAAIHKISGLGFQASAHFLAILFFALTSAGLITLVKEAGGDRRVMLAAGLLLFSSPYIVGSILPMVVRDHGFWTFHVWSIVFFVRFYRHHAWPHAWAWGFAALLAMLFRIEGIVYLAILPLVLLMQRMSWRNRVNSTIKAYVLPISAATIIIGALLLHPSLHLQDLGRLQDPAIVAENAYLQITHGLTEKSQLYAENVLGSFLGDYALPGILLTLAFALLIKAASSAGWLQLAFALHVRIPREISAKPDHGCIFGWLFLLGWINAVFIIASSYILPKRHVLPIGIIILVYAAFGLAALFDAWQRKSGRPIAANWLFYAAITAIALQTMAILRPSDPGNAFEQDAARWVREHAPAGSRIYYDHGRLRYYTTGESHTSAEASWAEVQQLVVSNQRRHYDYVLLHVSKKHPERQQFLTEKLGTPLVWFGNRRKKVLIYKIPQQIGNPYHRMSSLDKLPDMASKSHPSLEFPEKLDTKRAGDWLAHHGDGL